MEQRPSEEGEGGNRELLPDIPQHPVDRIIQLILPRRASPRDRPESRRALPLSFRSWVPGSIPYQQSKESHQGGVEVIRPPNRDQSQLPHERISDGLSLPPSTVKPIGNYWTQPGVRPQVNEFIARDFASGQPPLLAHSVEEIVIEGGNYTITPQSTSLSLIHPTDGYMNQINVGPPLQKSVTLLPPDVTAAREFTIGLPAPESIKPLESIQTPESIQASERKAAPEATEALIKKFNAYKLETDFYDSYVVHKTYEWDELSSRSWEISRWVKKRRIGSGAFGTVWLQEKEGVGQLRAVKQLPRDSSREESYSQELLALVKLKGYNHLFVDFLGWYEDVDNTFLAMEYIEYGDLCRYIKSPGTMMKTKEIIRQILEGLEILHAKGICHRDIKPQNILMASLDPIWVKIADFGISKRVKGTYQWTLIGTPGYLAPEVIGLLPRELKRKGFILHALDIWSLGSLAHELLTSETPFLGADEESGSDTGLQENLPSEREIDNTSLREYCYGTIEFPTDVLERSQVDEAGIEFVKSLLVADPNGRPTASHALKSPWLIGYTSGWVENLKNEFSQLGVDLGLGGNTNILMRQIDKEDIIRFLPNSKENVSSLLQKAVVKGYNLVISKILESPTSGLGSIDNLTRGGLFKLAIEARQLDTIKLLLKKEVDIRAFIGGKTMLQWAFKKGGVNLVDLLLKNTINVKTKDSCKELFLLAIKDGDLEMVKLFLSHKVEIDELKEAAGAGQVDLVRFLLDTKTDVNAKVLNDAFLEAVKGGHTGVVKFLLEKIANTNAILPDNCVQALQIAAKDGYIEIVKLLLEKNAYVNAKWSQSSSTLLQLAVEGGHTEIVKLLLGYKADANAVGSSGPTPLQQATEGGHTEIVKLLLESDADVNAVGSWSSSKPLQLAVEGGNTEIVKLLLENNAQVNAKGPRSSSTLLQLAVESGNTEIVKLLLENNAYVNAKGLRSSSTPLQQATEGGHTEIVKLLLEYSADVNAVGSWSGSKPLQLAVESGHTEIVKLLLENNAGVGAGSILPLHEAIGGGHTEIVKLLLENNADVNTHEPWSGSTPLQMATKRGHTKIVKLLLENDADFGAKGPWSGLTPLELATEGGHTGIVKLLLRKNADAKDKVSGYSSFT